MQQQTFDKANQIKREINYLSQLNQQIQTQIDRFKARGANPEVKNFSTSGPESFIPKNVPVLPAKLMLDFSKLDKGVVNSYDEMPQINFDRLYNFNSNLWASIAVYNYNYFCQIRDEIQNRIDELNHEFAQL